VTEIADKHKDVAVRSDDVRMPASRPVVLAGHQTSIFANRATTRIAHNSHEADAIGAQETTLMASAGKDYLLSLLLRVSSGAPPDTARALDFIDGRLCRLRRAFASA
jgi:hypothetical protein